MKIISWNVNGLRSLKKGPINLFRDFGADIVCLQEIKAEPSQLDEPLLRPQGYLSYFNSAQKKGYSGVAVYTKKEPLAIRNELGLTRFDSEGRMLRLDFDDLVLINLYLPHGGRQKENLDYKLESYNYLFRYLEALKGKKVLIVGDFNIAHTNLDLARPNSNRDNIMFTPEERKQLDTLKSLGFTDIFRKQHPQAQEYTWWPYMGTARARNVGWRIDYGFASENLIPPIKDSLILASDRSSSDHAPIEIII